MYDAVQEQFVDTEVQAEGPQGDEGPQGPAGPTGNGIASITKTGTSGLVDTYTITYTNGSTTTFTVTNGKDGTGSGDMSKSVYDQNNNGIVDNSEKLEGHGASYFARNQSMTGASSGTAGATGLVPAPAAGDQAKYLKGDGTWAKPAASELSFDNTGTGMTATNPQDAITELNADIHIDDVIGNVSTLDTWTPISFSDIRKYKYIMLVLSANTGMNVYATTLYPVARLVADKTVNCQFTSDASGYNANGLFKFKTNTTAELYLHVAGYSGVDLTVLGV